MKRSAPNSPDVARKGCLHGCRPCRSNRSSGLVRGALRPAWPSLPTRAQPLRFGIAQNPLAFPVVWRARVRRALVLDRFPYALYFTIDDDQFTVIACFHARRDPRRWQDRT